MNTTAKLFTLKNGLKIHADIAGSGPLLVCLSGFANTNHNFKLLAPHLSKRYTLCMIDARGMGKSAPATAEYRMDDLADDAYEIATQMGHKNFGVVGISLGGYPAQLMAMKYPNAIRAMAVIATRGPSDKYEIIRAVTEEGFTAFMKMDPAVGDRIAISAFVHPSFLKNHPEKIEELIKLRAAENRFTLEQALMQLRAGFTFIHSNPDMSTIKAPTLIIAGGEDSFLPKQNAELLHKEVKNSVLCYIPETSHLCFFEKPQEVSNQILNFMNPIML